MTIIEIIYKYRDSCWTLATYYKAVDLTARTCGLQAVLTIPVAGVYHQRMFCGLRFYTDFFILISLYTDSSHLPIFLQDPLMTLPIAQSPSIITPSSSNDLPSRVLSRSQLSLRTMEAGLPPVSISSHDPFASLSKRDMIIA